MNKNSKAIKGIYLVIDPSMEENALIKTLEKIVLQQPCAIQIWDNFKTHDDISTLIFKIKAIFRDTNIPILINNHPDWVEEFGLGGVHFDKISREHLSIISNLKKQGKTIGVTINNDFEVIRKAIDADVDYLSFCSIFPSSMANSCEIVSFETIKNTRKITSIPIFLAGGITTENIYQLQSLEFDGIAVISGVMGAEDPAKAISSYQKLLTDLKK